MVSKQVIYKGNVYKNTKELSRVINLPIRYLDELVSFVSDNVLTDDDIKSYIEYIRRSMGTENTTTTNSVKRLINQGLQSVKPIDLDSIIKRKEKTMVSTVQTANPEFNKMTGHKLEEDSLRDIERQKKGGKIKKEKLSKKDQLKKEKQRQRQIQNKLAIDELEKIVPRDNNNKIVHQNIAYESIEQLCKIYEVTPVVLLNKFKYFGNLDDAIRFRRYIPKISCCGKWYSSMSQLLRENNIEKDDLTARMNKGLTLEQAVALGPSPHKKLEVIYGGTQYKNRRDLCDKLGLSYDRLSNLISAGHSLEEALDIVYEEKETGVRIDRNSSAKKVTFLGVKYNSIASLAAAYGLSVVTLRKKLKETNQVEQVVIEMIRRKQQGEGKIHK